MARKTKTRYLTDEEIFTIECNIHNNLSTYLDSWVDELDAYPDLTVLRKELKKKEDFVSITEYMDIDYGHVVATSFGRVINTHRGTNIKPTISKLSVHVRIDQNKVPLVDIFEAEGWEYNIPKFIKNYDKYGWGYIDIRKRKQKK